MNVIYLYLKIHNVTRLKYLGKTIQNPHKYKGSGTHWKRHIEKYGYDVTTEILFKTKNKEEFKKVAIEYSKKLNIIESKEFANLKLEEGDGGDTFSGKKHSKQTIQKMQKSQRERDKNTWARGEKNGMAKRKGLPGKKHSEEAKELMSKNRKGKGIGPYENRKIAARNRADETYVRGKDHPQFGKPSNNLGKKQNQEVKDKIQQTRKIKKSCCKRTILDGIEYESVKAAMAATGYTFYTIKKLIASV